MSTLARITQNITATLKEQLMELTKPQPIFRTRNPEHLDELFFKIQYFQYMVNTPGNSVMTYEKFKEKQLHQLYSEYLTAVNLADFPWFSTPLPFEEWKTTLGLMKEDTSQ